MYLTARTLISRGRKDLADELMEFYDGELELMSKIVKEARNLHNRKAMSDAQYFYTMARHHELYAEWYHFTKI